MPKFNDGEFDADRLTKIFDLQVGRCRVNAAVGSGYDIAAVSLLDIRRREIKLVPVTRESFERRAPGIIAGGDPAAHLYAVPTCYWLRPRAADGTGLLQLYLWPVPLHAWRLRVTYKLSAVGERLREMATR